MNNLGDSIFSWGIAARMLTWGAIMVGVLQLRHLSGSWSHVICGPWGCGPPLEAVVTCHLVWIVLLTPLVLVMNSRMTPAALRLSGWMATGMGIVGLAAVAVWVGTVWYPQAGSFQRPYVWQKYVYTVVCLVDVPLIQVTLCGGVLLALSRRARSRAFDASGPVASPDSWSGE